ncbi:MAG TPA: M20/M25/M40 family metallo-hydrolase, partial [Vicinamibacteria bacterium]|nr:M20/M25/M40 family metallo-hydrolase [Vicinamibacteria bacterium]
RIAKLLADVSPARLQATLKKLESFQTRHLLSSTATPGRGIGAARQWILDEMKSYSPRLEVSFDTYRIPKQGDRVTREVEVRNVMAVLPGRTARRFYVSGHYDTVARPVPTRGAAPVPSPSPSPDAGTQSASGGFDWSVGDNLAPGVNDDGSGSALTMELARVFAQSGLEFDATLVFICFAGEEQGLIGAKLHAQRAEAEKLTIDGVLNNDIVGNATSGQGVKDTGTVRVFSEGPEDSPSRQLARAIRRNASLYVPEHRVRLIARYDRFGRGGDHSAFNQRGYPGVRFTESKENYGHQHTVDDTFAGGLDAEYLARNARVNAATLATLGLAPVAPVVVDERGRPLLTREPSGYDARLRWRAAPGAAGYRIFWREAWTPDWQFEQSVGAVTEVVLPGVSIDDFVFGVAAVDAEGHESLVSAYVNPSRPDAPVQTLP